MLIMESTIVEQSGVGVDIKCFWEGRSNGERQRKLPKWKGFSNLPYSATYCFVLYIQMFICVCILFTSGRLVCLPCYLYPG